MCIRDRVNDAMGPVIGASVVEKGNATNGTITDIDGNFSLKVPSDATLTISFIGYKTVELPVAGKTSFTVTLKEDSEMLVTVEPCIMCAGATGWAQVGRVGWGADGPKPNRCFGYCGIRNTALFGVQMCIRDSLRPMPRCRR